VSRVSDRARVLPVLVGLAVLLVGAVVRAVPLHYSPLPATMDGYSYVTLSATLLETGQLAHTGAAADTLGFTALLAAGSLGTGVPPLTLAQPLVVVVGATGPLVAIAVTARVGRDLGWPSRRVRIAALLAGLTLAVEGLYVRRTGVPDEEAVGLVLVPLLALAAHRALASRRPAWVVVAGVLVAGFPPLHNLSSIVAALTVTAVAAAHVAASPDRARLALGVGGTAVTWTYVFGFYAVAERVGLTLSYSGIVRDHPGLLLAWVFVLALVLAWYGAATPTARRVVLFGPVLLGFFALIANFVRPVYPGTVPTPPLVLAFVSLLVVPVLVAADGAGWVSVRGEAGDGTVAVAVLAAPAAMSYFALTGSLTPDLFGMLIRVQTFAHLGAFVLAALGAAHYLGRTRWLGRVLVAGLVVTATLTVPLAHVHLDTVTYPSTSFESEYDAVGFAATSVDGPFATDNRLARIDTHAYGADGRATDVPTRRWLRGGAPPACPTLYQRSWTTSGAHLYPSPPGTLAPDDARAWRGRNSVVYASTGRNPLWLVVPAGGGSGGC